jgi:hypothetical protein
VSAPLDIAHLHTLLGHATGLDAAHGAQCTHDLKGESCMLAGDEPGPPFVDLAQKGTGTEVPVLHPEITRMHGLQHQPQHGAFLGMAILTGKDIAHQAVGGLIDNQGLPRQGAALHLAQGFEAPVTRLKTIAINNFHAVPR